MREGCTVAIFNDYLAAEKRKVKEDMVRLQRKAWESI